VNLKDFYILATKILELLEEKDTTTLYQNLISHLNSIRNNPTSDLQQSINQTVQQIVELNASAEQELMRIPHASFMLERLNVTEYIGYSATKRLEDILRTEMYIAANSVNELMQGISSTKVQLRTILDEFSKFDIEYSSEDVPIFSIEYNGTEEVETTDDLKVQLSEIEKVIHAFARLANDPEAFAKPQILTISKSSPLIIDIGANLANGLTHAGTLLFVGKAIHWSMDRIEQLYDIRIKREEFKKQKLHNKTLEKGFDELEEKQTSEAEIKRFVNKLYKEASPGENAGAEEETKKALLEAVKTILKLVGEGSTLNVYMPVDKEDESDEQESVDDITLQIGLSYRQLDNKQAKLKELGSGLTEVVDDEKIHEAKD
jgi:hypothetical protein